MKTNKNQQQLRVKIRDVWYLVEILDIDSNPAKVLVDGVSQFHSEDGLKLIREAASLWTTKNRGFFQTLRNMG